MLGFDENEKIRIKVVRMMMMKRGDIGVFDGNEKWCMLVF